MNVLGTDVDGVVIIEPKVFGDERGFFLETFQAKRYRETAGIDFEFVQDNYSRSARGVLRGMHFQRSQPQGKLVRVARGAVFDAVVDIRPGSATFGKWTGLEINEDNKRQLWIPPGLAHGFLVLSEFADFEYKCTDYYNPTDEGTLSWDDADVGIEWPLETSPTLSAKDREGESFAALTR